MASVPPVTLASGVARRAAAPALDWPSARAALWTGLFTDHRVESAYRAATWTELAARVRLVAWVGALFYVMGWAVDAFLVGAGPRLWLLLVIRVAVAATILSVVIFGVREPTRWYRVEWSVTAALTVLVVGTMVIIALSPGEVIEHAVTVMVIALVLYLFVPIAPSRTTWICLGFSGAFVLFALSRFHPAPNQIALVGLYLLLVNLFGAVGDRLLQRAVRHQYAALAAERESRRELVEEAEARRDAERALAASEMRYRTLVETSPYAIVVHRDGRVLYVNPTATRIIGAAGPSELVGRDVTDFISPRDHELVRERLQQLNQTTVEVPAAQFAVRTVAGELIDVEVISSRAWYGEGPAVQTVISDITERKRLEDELRRLATVDMLTGARNRHSFFLQGEAELARARRHGRPLAAVMLDLDRFKEVNDRHGHAVGDDVLKAFGKLCRRALRAEDLFGRIGGEEFATLLPDVDAESALVVAERLRVEVGQLRIEAPAGFAAVTVSAGVTALAPGDDGLDDMLKRADDALYDAKRAGRDRVVLR